MPVQTAHAIDYSSNALKSDGAVACQNEIVRFVRGIRGPRSGPVSKSQIVKWFRVTPAEFVERQIEAACLAGRIRICARNLKSHRRANGAYVYEIADDRGSPHAG